MSCAPYTPYQDDVFPPELAYSDEAPEEYEDVLPESWLNEDCDWSYWEWDDSKTDYWEQIYPEYFEVQPAASEAQTLMNTRNTKQLIWSEATT